MGIAKFASVLCIAAVFWTQGESRRLCGLEVEYSGYDPIEALRFIEERQIQEFTQFSNLLNQLKFRIQTDDYRAWKRCIKEYERAKLKFIRKCKKVRRHFKKHLKKLSTRKLAAEQYQLELQNLLGQFELQFQPTVETFHTNIKTLLDTIQDDKLRKQWWSTVKTTETTTGPDGSQTRTSISETSSGIGGQQTGFSKTSETVSKKVGTKIGTVVGGSSNSGSSGFQSESQSSGGYQQNDNDDNDSDNNDGSSGYESNVSFGRSQSQSSYGASSEQSSQSESNSGASSGSSGYGAASAQVTKQSSSTVRSGMAAGSSVDNSQINFSQVQTRTDIKEGSGYSASSQSGFSSSSKSGYSAQSENSDSSNGDYRRKRRTLGLLAGVLGSKRSAQSGGDAYGGAENTGNGGGAGVGVGVNVGVGLGVGAGSGAGVGVGTRVGLGGGQGGAGFGTQGERGGLGVGRGGGFGSGQDSGFQTSSSGFQSGSGSYSARNLVSDDSFSDGDSGINDGFQKGGYSKTIKKEKFQETRTNFGSSGLDSSSQGFGSNGY